MGPITLFDKSFLQSLNVDEAVWFDHHFLTNVCPLFYVETLADLDKSVREGRTPEQEVGQIADKFPQMHGSPNAYHVELCIANLMGQPIPMEGRIPLAGGRLVKSNGKSGVVYDQSPEAEAFSRWSNGEFLDVERQFARVWREALSTLDLAALGSTFRAIGVDGKLCKSLNDAYLIASSVVNGQDKPFDRMKLAILFFSVPQELHRPILERWSVAGYPALSRYAPYAAYVLTVEVFFQLAIAANHISSARPSNRTDIAYLFYLPFCMMFVSSDKLHRKCAPLFLRSNQEFIWGTDLKESLGRLNAHYLGLRDEEKEKGIMSFANGPPQHVDSLVAKLWDRHVPAWRGLREVTPPTDTARSKELVDELNRFSKAPVLSPEEVDFDPRDPDSLSLQRFVQKKRGSWWQLPKNLEPSKGRGN